MSLPNTMQAIHIKNGKSDSAKDLYLDSTQLPKPSKSQVLVKISAFGMNRMDILQRRGLYPLPPGTSDILGVEFSGTVAKSSGDKWKEGQDVFGLATGGAYAEYIAAEESLIIEKPSHLPHSKAASIPENWLTAYQAVVKIAAFQKGESILVHAGASGVGVAAIQIAKAFGADKVFTTAGTKEKCEFLRTLGADVAINYREEDWAKQISEVTSGKGVDVIIDFVGAKYWEQNIDTAARDGRIVMLGLLGGAKAEKTDLGKVLFKRLRIEASTLRSRSVAYQAELLRDFQADVLPKIVQGVDGDKNGMKLVISKTEPWDKVVEVTEFMEANQNIGKLVLTIDNQ